MHDDQRCHLFGTSKLLNSISSFASDSGLRESASWAFLRQHIYISFTKQHPINIDLENYKYSSVFHTNDDEAWANRIIYLFAVVLDKILRHGQGISTHELGRLEGEVEAWYTSKPWDFSPLWGSHSPDTNDPWPQLYMSHPAHGKLPKTYCSYSLTPRQS